MGLFLYPLKILKKQLNTLTHTDTRKTQDYFMVNMYQTNGQTIWYGKNKTSGKKLSTISEKKSYTMSYKKIKCSKCDKGKLTRECVVT